MKVRIIHIPSYLHYINTTYINCWGHRWGAILKLELIIFSLLRPECNCNTQGVDKLSGSEDLDLTCDAESGKCHCRCDVDGDKCDACVAGHHTFPDCHGKYLI